MQLHKYHALGNDYLVLDSRRFSLPTAAQVQAICSRHYGLGSDGIVYGPISGSQGLYQVIIFNPDGSQAEKSGNGIRIFARFLYDEGLVNHNSFYLETTGGVVGCRIDNHGIEASMGQVFFGLNNHDSFGMPLTIDDVTYTVYPGNIGNPHCVLLVPKASPEYIQTIGPKIENHPLFANKTNVQLLEIIDQENIRIEIWERGAGYTLASGSSASFAGAVSYHLGQCSPQLSVHMPGGTLQVNITPSLEVTIYGPVKAIGHMTLAKDFFE